jgi:hypothetical protein
MALTRFGFIVTGDDFVQWIDVVAQGPESISGMSRLFPE